jgi:cytochrome c-type biogenesis protein CcmH
LGHRSIARHLITDWNGGVVKFDFYLVASVMIVTALLTVIRPLLRTPHRQRSPELRIIALAIAVLLPTIALILYSRVGTPSALESQAMGPARSLSARDATADADSPAGHRAAQAWLDQAQAFDAQQRPGEAREAYGKALELDPADTVAMVGWVEADMTQHANYAIGDAARQLLQRATALDPFNQRALWLFGISQFQQGHYADASATWRRLQQQLDAGSAMAQAVAQQIAKANAKTGSEPATHPH